MLSNFLGVPLVSKYSQRFAEIGTMAGTTEENKHLVEENVTMYTEENGSPLQPAYRGKVRDANS